MTGGPKDEERGKPAIQLGAIRQFRNEAGLRSHVTGLMGQKAIQEGKEGQAMVYERPGQGIFMPNVRQAGNRSEVISRD